MTASDTRSTLKFTRMCKYWSSNRCTMGDACNFAHSDTELREQPDLVATKLCFQFMSKGRCNKGAACTFAHGKKELRQMPPDQERGGNQSRQGRKNFEPMKINTQMAKEVSAASLGLPSPLPSPLPGQPLSPSISVLSPGLASPVPGRGAGPPGAGPLPGDTVSQMKAVQSKLEQLVLGSNSNGLIPPFRPPPGLAPPPSPASICSPCSPLSPKSAGYKQRGGVWASTVLEDDDAIVNFSSPMDNTTPAVLKLKDLDTSKLSSFPLGLEMCDSEPVSPLSPKSEIVWL